MRSWKGSNYGFFPKISVVNSASNNVSEYQRRISLDLRIFSPDSRFLSPNTRKFTVRHAKSPLISPESRLISPVSRFFSRDSIIISPDLADREPYLFPRTYLSVNCMPSWNFFEKIKKIMIIGSVNNTDAAYIGPG